MIYRDTTYNTFLSLCASTYIGNIGGTLCWLFSDMTPFAVSLSGLKRSSNTLITLLIEYYDSGTGYIRMCYDDNGTPTYTTLCQKENTLTWNVVQHNIMLSLNDTMNPGDFCLFSSTSEDSHSDLSWYCRKVALFYDDTHVTANWQPAGVRPFTEREVSGQIVGFPSSCTVLSSSAVLTPAQCQGGIIVVPNASYNITLPAVSTLSDTPLPNVLIIFYNSATTIYPNGSDRLRVGGEELSDGTALTSVSKGCIHIFKDSSHGWSSLGIDQGSFQFGGGK